MTSPDISHAGAPVTTKKYDPVTRAVLAAVFSCAIIQGSFGGLLPFMSDSLNMSHTVESMHVMAMSLGGMVFSLAAEPIRRSIGRLNSLGLALGLAVIGGIILALAVNAVMTITGMLFLGTAMGGVLIVGQNLLAAIHQGRSPRMIGEFNVAFSLAALVCVLLLPYLAGSVLGWRAYPGLQILALVLFSLPLYLRARKNIGLVIEPVHHGGEVKVGNRHLNWRPIATMGIAIALEWSLIFWTALFLIDVAGITAAQGAVATAVMLAAILAGRVAGAVLLEKIGAWRVLIFSVLLAVLTLVLMLGATTVASAYVAAAIAGVTASNIYPACIGLVLGGNPQTKDLALARASLISTIATVVWPLSLGVIADQIGLTNAIYFLFVLVGLALIALVWAHPKRHARQEILFSPPL